MGSLEMFFNTVEDLVEHIDSISKYVEKAYREIAREIRERNIIAFLTSGWLKSPGCSSTITFSSLLKRANAYHLDLGFFARHIAPYYEAGGERELGLIIYENPTEPWKSHVSRHIKSLSLLGLEGIVIRIRSASISGGDIGMIEEGFRIIEIPSNMDIVLTHHMLSLRAILEVAGERALSPRIARVLSEISDLGYIVPDMINRYCGIVKDIGSKAQGSDIALISTCTSRSFFEGLLLDGYNIPTPYDAYELQRIAGASDGKMILAYVEAEKDLIPIKQITIQSGRAIELVLKTDPVISPIYFRLLSMILKIRSI